MARRVTKAGRAHPAARAPDDRPDGNDDIARGDVGTSDAARAVIRCEPRVARAQQRHGGSKRAPESPTRAAHKVSRSEIGVLEYGIGICWFGSRSVGKSC